LRIFQKKSRRYLILNRQKFPKKQLNCMKKMLNYEKEYWQKYGGHFEPKHAQLALAWGEELKPNKILDAGCGLGHYVKAFYDLGFDVYGFDCSAWAIDNCPYKQIKHRLKKGSICNIPFRKNFADLVICIDVLEHLTEEEIKLALQELHRVSSKFVLFFITPVESPNFKLDETHITGWNMQRWIYEIQMAGFKIIKASKRLPFREQTIIARI
jgi:2-polyprenyl-3-methyl-5-hydroxy-6-metoxy-1,4-benzoquinol methylase